MRAVRITEFGGPEVLRIADVASPEPTPGHLLIDVSLAGVNFADTHQAENSYLSAQTLPLIPGAEVVGTVHGTARRVVALAAGGGYAEQTVVNPAFAFDVPPAVSDAQALALVLQGVTAWHVLRTSAHLVADETVVVHAAAGGVGTLAVQLARLWGAGRVIAAASTAEKRALAIELGAHVAVDSTDPDLTGALREANNGHLVDVVLEMNGGRAFDQSLAALAPFGRLVTYGMASRTAPRPVEVGALMAGSRAVVGFWLAHCFGRSTMLADAMSDLLARTAAGTLTPVLGGEYALSDVQQAHHDIRSRGTVGKLVLDPSR
jgi:NADPH2:quinone reductase